MYELCTARQYSGCGLVYIYIKVIQLINKKALFDDVKCPQDPIEVLKANDCLQQCVCVRWQVKLGQT